MAELEQDRVFGALTRPQMFAGVTYGCFVANVILATELFLFLRSPLVLAVAGVIHCIAYLMCLDEPRLIDLWINRLVRCPRTPDYREWGCNSYGP